MASLRDRFFVEGVHVLGESITFAADDARKIATVLRGRNGDRVLVIDSAGSAFEAVLVVVDGEVAAMLDEPIERATRETAVRLTLAQAIPKGQKMDLIVEKATDLGVAAIVPLRSESPGAVFEMMFAIVDRAEEGPRLQLEYNPRYFKSSTIHSAT